MKTKQNPDYTAEAMTISSTPPASSEMDGNGDEGVRRTKSLVMNMITQLTLRGLAVAFTLAAIITTVTAKQTVNVGILTFKVRYHYSSAIRFQVGANAVVCVFSFLSMLLLPTWITHPKSDPGNYFYLLLHDMVMTMLVISGCAAGSTVGYLAKKGQQQGSWIALCKYLDKFCDQIQVALALSYLAFLCMFALAFMAASKLKSQVTHSRILNKDVPT